MRFLKGKTLKKGSQIWENPPPEPPPLVFGRSGLEGGVGSVLNVLMSSPRVFEHARDGTVTVFEPTVTYLLRTTGFSKIHIKSTIQLIQKLSPESKRSRTRESEKNAKKNLTPFFLGLNFFFKILSKIIIYLSYLLRTKILFGISLCGFCFLEI